MLGDYSIFSMVLFIAVIATCLVVDLRAHKEDSEITAKSAGKWVAFWVFLALLFGLYIWYDHGFDAFSLFMAGYLLEESLSVDNLFVIMALFASFGVVGKYQHRVLFYGIMGAIVMRLTFILVGASLIKYFGNYALTAFGVFIIWTAWKMWSSMKKGDTHIEDYSDHWSVRLTKRFIPVYPRIESHNFFVRHQGKLAATPLFLCLIVIEIVDVMFAFDSVPAVLAITHDPFLVFTSNIFAILGMRSMYFFLAAAKKFLVHLEKAVIGILLFIGVKMLVQVAFGQHLPTYLSLGVVLVLLAAGVLASLIWPGEPLDAQPPAPASDAAVSDNALGLQDPERHVPDSMEGLGAANGQGGVEAPTETPPDVEKLEGKNPQRLVDGDAADGRDGSE